MENKEIISEDVVQDLSPLSDEEYNNLECEIY